MNIRCSDLIPILQTVLTSGGRVRFTATGASMIPFIRGGETVELEPIAFSDIQRGDILLARRADGVYVLHRVAQLADQRVFLVSDAGRLDGWIEADQIIGRAASVFRRGRELPLNTPGARRTGLIWMRCGSLATGALSLYLALRRRIRLGGREQECKSNPT